MESTYENMAMPFLTQLTTTMGTLAPQNQTPNLDTNGINDLIFIYLFLGFLFCFINFFIVFYLFF